MRGAACASMSPGEAASATAFPRLLACGGTSHTSTFIQFVVELVFIGHVCQLEHSSAYQQLMQFTRLFCIVIIR